MQKLLKSEKPLFFKLFFWLFTFFQQKKTENPEWGIYYFKIKSQQIAKVNKKTTGGKNNGK